MRQIIVFLGFGTIIGCNGSQTAIEPALPQVSWSPELQPIAEGNNQFACDFFAKLRETKGNLFFSPYSIHTALAMTATGANGLTREEMVNVLHLPKDESKMLAAGDLGRFYAQPHQDNQLSMANAIWGQKGFPWRLDFLEIENQRFGAGFREADFHADPDAERQRINDWVAGQTRHLIKDLIGPDILTKETRIVLANAIYFKGTWAEEFKKEATQPAPFRLADGKTVETPMMHHHEDYAYLERDQFQMVALPYQGGELQMLVLLPKDVKGLPELEMQLTAKNLDSWLKQMNGESVQLSLPRFKMEMAFEPDRSLQSMGMQRAYLEDADFTGMYDRRWSEDNIFISRVIHKAFVEVNEEGTVAAAATAVVGMVPVSANIYHEPKIFNADHPFLFLIRDAKHGIILFLGRVEKP